MNRFRIGFPIDAREGTPSYGVLAYVDNGDGASHQVVGGKSSESCSKDSGADLISTQIEPDRWKRFIFEPYPEEVFEQYVIATHTSRKKISPTELVTSGQSDGAACALVWGGEVEQRELSDDDPVVFISCKVTQQGTKGLRGLIFERVAKDSESGKESLSHKWEVVEASWKFRRTALVLHEDDVRILAGYLDASRFQRRELADLTNLKKTRLDEKPWIIGVKSDELADLAEVLGLPRHRFDPKLRFSLPPLDFIERFQEAAVGFVGREWLRKEVETWLDDPDGSQVLVIEGEPGTGKTAIVGWLADWLGPRVAALYGCGESTIPVGQHGDPKDGFAFVDSLVQQLYDRIPGYRGRVLALEKGPEIRRDTVEIAVGDLLSEPLKDFLASAVQRVLLIDALDEGSKDQNDNVWSAIRTLQKGLPLWLRMVVTSCPEGGIHELKVNGAQPISLHGKDAKQRRDVGRYLLYRSEQLPREIKNSFRNVQADLEESLDGNFLFAKQVMQDLLERVARFSSETADVLLTDALRSAKKGFSGYLLERFDRIFSQSLNPFLWDNLKPALETIGAAFQALPESLLLKATGLTLPQLQYGLVVLSSFLRSRKDGGEAVYDFSHRYMREWITTKEKSGKWYCETEEGHRRLSDVGTWRKGEEISFASGAYCIQYLPNHLIYSGRKSEAASLLTEISYLNVKISSGLLRQLISDYNYYQLNNTENAPPPIMLDYIAFIKKDFNQLLAKPYLFLQLAANQHISESVRSAAIESIDRDNHPAWLVSLEPSTGQNVFTSFGDIDRYNCIAYSKTNNIVAAGSSDGNLTVFNLSTFDVPVVIENLGQLTCCSLSNDSKYVALGNKNGLLSIYDIKGRVRIGVIRFSDDIIECKYVAGSDLLFYSTTEEFGIIGKSEEKYKIIESTFIEKSDMINCIEYSTRDKCYFIGSRSGKLYRYRRDSKEMSIIADEWETCIVSCALSPDGQLLVTGHTLGDKGVVYIWDTAKEKLILQKVIHDGFIEKCIITNDGEFVVTCSKDATIKIHRIVTIEECEKCALEIINQYRLGSRVYSISLSQDVTRVACVEEAFSDVKIFPITPPAASNRRTIMLNGIEHSCYNIGDREISDIIDTAKRNGFAKAYNDHGYIIDTEFSNIKIRNKSDENNTILRGHSSLITDWTIDNAGKYLYSVAWDGQLKIWDIEAKTLIYSLTLFTSIDGLSNPTVGITQDDKYIVVRNKGATTIYMARPYGLQNSLAHNGIRAR